MAKKIKDCLNILCKGRYGGFPTDYKYCPYCGKELIGVFDLVRGKDEM
jgi:hypothetical protein